MHRSVLAVGAHPDDVEFGVGGTLARHAAAGDLVRIMVLTGGEAGIEVTEVRRREAEEAASLIGAEITIGKLADTRIAEKDAIDLVETLLRGERPGIAYIHTASDTHQDHRAAAYACRVALRAVPRMYAYQAPSATEEFRPARYTGLQTRHLARKLEMVERHKSQGGRWYATSDYIRSAAAYWGARSGGGYAEPLEVLRDRVG
jgi:two-component system, NtrC family, response regulator HydG